MRSRQATTPPAPLVASGDADVKVGAGTKPPTNPDDGAPVTAVPATYQRRADVTLTDTDRAVLA